MPMHLTLRWLVLPALAFLIVVGVTGQTRSAAPESATPAAVDGYRIIDRFPHDPEAFTQGLVYTAGQLLEGTGQYGKSVLRRVDLETGDVLQQIALDDDYFGEGISLLDDRIYQLTWRENRAFVYDAETFELLETFSYPGEGWGLTTDGEQLIMSDGTSTITFRDPQTFARIREIIVMDGDLGVSWLNELEYIDGEIWANVYRTDTIVRIDPETGDVLGWIDLSGLLPVDLDQVANAPDVLNGIAHDPGTGRIFVTGKYWPLLFEIEVVPRF